MKERIDIVLVKKGLARSRSQAKLMIDEGLVFYQGSAVSKSGLLVNQNEVSVHQSRQFVGRGALKLEKAVEYFGIDFTRKTVADIGASTGGFTDVALEKGALKIYAIDVGHNQLSKELLNDQRVINMERVNVRYRIELKEKVDICLVDLSYISLRLTLKNVFDITKSNGKIIALVKPQFEVGPKNIGKKGIVKDKKVRLEALEDLYDWCVDNNLYIMNAVRSSITGKMGNIEYFFYFDKKAKKFTFPRKRLALL